MKYFKLGPGTRLLAAVFALALVGGSAAMSLTANWPSASAASPRSGELHAAKECSAYTGAAGDFCTVTSSNLQAIPVGSRIVYASAADWNALTLDSDVVLRAGPANTAFGHCTVRLDTFSGQCTFSGGTGKFTWFHALVDVSPLEWPNFGWVGTYDFSP